MEVFNGTGETLKQMYDGVTYVFPPNEVVRLGDDCGAHCLLQQSVRGLQEIRWGDEPEELGAVAINAIVNWHRQQIEAHETQVRVASESKNPIPEEPEAYKLAKRRLPAYEKVMVERQEDAEANAAAAEEAAIRAALGKPTGEIKALEDMDVDELRAVVRSFTDDDGNPVEPNMRIGHKKLIAQIEELRAEVEEE